MLDNVLDVTACPLPQQQQEAMSKRRIGGGFLGLGTALIFLGVRYNSPQGRAFAAQVAETLRDESYLASVELAKERGPFPLFDAEKYLAGGFAKTLPDHIRAAIRKHGIRNSHCGSIAPVGTGALGFGDNCSSGIEPSFGWTYTRKKVMLDGSKQEYVVEDHAYRVYREMGHDVNNLPDYFVTAFSMTAMEQLEMVKAVAPFMDSAISKTINVPEDYPFEDFEQLYLEAWKAGIKGITTYRPNDEIGSVLSVSPTPAQTVSSAPSDLEDPDRRVRLDAVPDVASSLAYPSRPVFDGGNMAWSYMMEVPGVIDAGLFVGQNDGNVPFEAWVNGADQPRGLGAVAKVLSIDMRAGDRAWLKFKLEKLMKSADSVGFAATFPGHDGQRHFPGVVPYFAQLVNSRCEQLGAFSDMESLPTPLMDALLFKKEPKSKGTGTMSWTWDVTNHRSADDFVVYLKEMEMPDGSVRPYSVWLSGTYPKVLDGLCKLLSVDMWVYDPSWIALKLRKLLNYSEAELDFMAWVPGNGKQAHYPSSIAYIAHLILHRYKALGLLDEEGNAIRGGLVHNTEQLELPLSNGVMKGKECPECHAHAVVKKDGCTFCTECGYVGSCG
jgi:ribonucleoside-diphosphate reductase alpha chain